MKYTSRPPRPIASYIAARNARTHGNLLVKRRNLIADMWSGRYDGRRWTALEIADEINIQMKGVYGHLRVLRLQGDPRAFRRPEIGTKRAENPLRMAYAEAAE